MKFNLMNKLAVASFLLTVFSAVSCVDRAASSFEKSSLCVVDDPIASCYQIHGEFRDFEEMRQEGFFTHEELVNIIYRNDKYRNATDLHLYSMGPRGPVEVEVPDWVKPAPDLDPEIEKLICDDYFNYYWRTCSEDDLSRFGNAIPRENFTIDAYCGGFRGYHIFRFVDVLGSPFEQDYNIEMEGYVLRYYTRNGEFLKAWKAL
jgi:hypothetical protein